MKLHKKNWTVLFTIFCAVLCLHMFARAAQPTSRNVINITHCGGIHGIPKRRRLDSH